MDERLGVARVARRRGEKKKSPPKPLNVCSEFFSSPGIHRKSAKLAGARFVSRNDDIIAQFLESKPPFALEFHLSSKICDGGGGVSEGACPV